MGMASEGVSGSRRSSWPREEAGKWGCVFRQGAAVVKTPEGGAAGRGEARNQRKSQGLDQRETVLSQNTGL